MGQGWYSLHQRDRWKHNFGAEKKVNLLSEYSDQNLFHRKRKKKSKNRKQIRSTYFGTAAVLARPVAQMSAPKKW